MNVLKEIVRLEQEAAHFGFRWEKHSQIIEQIRSECLEIQAHLNDIIEDADDAKLQVEIGDLLHAAFSLCVFCQFDPKETLEKSVKKFNHRFKAVKQIAHLKGLATLQGRSSDELMKIWEQAKEQVG